MPIQFNHSDHYCLTIVYSTVCSGADQRKHQSYVSLAFVWGIHRWPVNSPHKWPVTRKMFPFDDVIMTKTGISLCMGLVLGHDLIRNTRPSNIPGYNAVITNDYFYLCRILVLDQGRTASFDTPANLLTDESSIFYSMVMHAGLI